MRRKLSWLGAVLFVLLQMAANSQRASAATAMIFCNGNMGSASGLTASQITGLRASGFTTMVLFTMTVQSNGDFTFGDGSTVCSGGSYMGPTNWPTLLGQCRTAPSGISRIEMCIGGWGDPSFANIKNRIATDGTGSTTVLYENLQALRSGLGIDAVDYDDESTYDSGSATSFGQMCGAAGMKVTLCPYTNPGYWQAVKSGLGSTCDQVYLQCYDGGAGNNPATWNTYFGGLKVVTGYWDYERDTTFLNEMVVGRNAGCTGGFLWPSCTGCNPPADGNEMSQYAAWILDTFNPVVTPVTASDVVGGQVTFTAPVGGSNLYQWRVIRNGVTNTIFGATNATLTLSNLQLTNTASYQLWVSNSTGAMVSSLGSLTVSNMPAAVNNVVTACAAQTGLGYGIPFTPTWTIRSGSVIYGQAPSITNGDFDLEAYWGNRSVNSLTTGGSLTIAAGGSTTTTSTNYVTCGNGGSPTAGATVIYTLTNTSAGGYYLTNITVYGGWRDGGRDQQAYTVYYSKISAPATFLLLGSVNYNPVNTSNAPSATRATLAPAAGALATNVAAVKFDFTSPASENGYCGYAGIGLFGVPVSPVVATNPLPVTAADVVGDQVTFTVAFTAATPMAYQWQKISGGITNNVSGATNTTLTLTNLQLTDTANYQCQATNFYGTAVSQASSLTVSSLPAPVNNVVTAIAAQTGTGSGTFTPTWTVVTNGSLIAGAVPSSSAGNFSMEIPGRSVNSLTAGGTGALTQIPATSGYTTSTDYVTCGNGYGAGSSVAYTLSGSPTGYTLTNLTVYGGWADAGRDQQAYTVSYSVIAAPATFIPLGTVNFNPANPANAQSATRISLIPATGVLATNVAAVKFDFTSPASENGYCGYSQIALFGVPTWVMATNPTNITAQVMPGAMAFSWPSDHTGWRLQVQTNEVNVGLGTNWVDVPGATATNQMIIPIDPAVAGVFYRLAL